MFQVHSFAQNDTKNVKTSTYAPKDIKLSQQRNYEMPFEIKKMAPLRSQSYSRSGNWTSYEKLKFVLFLEFHQSNFNENGKRRSMKIFKYMSQFIKTKSSKQCRSHHQKVGKKYEDAMLFVNVIKKSMGILNYQCHYHLFLQELEELHKQMGSLLQISNYQHKTQIQKKKKFSGARGTSQEKLEVQQLKMQEIQEGKKTEIIFPTETSYKTYKQYQKIDNDFEPLNNTPSNINSGLLIQRVKLLQECSYFWNNWIRSVSRLEEINNKLTYIPQ